MSATGHVNSATISGRVCEEPRFNMVGPSRATPLFTFKLESTFPIPGRETFRHEWTVIKVWGLLGKLLYDSGVAVFDAEVIVMGAEKESSSWDSDQKDATGKVVKRNAVDYVCRAGKAVIIPIVAGGALYVEPLNPETGAPAVSNGAYDDELIDDEPVAAPVAKAPAPARAPQPAPRAAAAPARAATAPAKAPVRLSSGTKAEPVAAAYDGSDEPF